MNYYHYCNDKYDYGYDRKCKDRRDYDYDRKCRDRCDYDYERGYNPCCRPGPIGPSGAPTTIKGSYDTLCELLANHPIGNLGDAYLVAGILYVWNPKHGTYGGWERIGSLCGPTGPSGATGPIGPTGPTGPFLSSYLEAVGTTQVVGVDANVVFDVSEDYIDIVGRDISVNATGTVFTIHRAGLYHVEWSMNITQAASSATVGLLENNEASSALAHGGTSGTHSSGALIEVTAADLPYTISLHNFNVPISIADTPNLRNTAVSIRIMRFADGSN